MSTTIHARLVFDESSQLEGWRAHLWHRYRIWMQVRSLACLTLLVAALYLIFSGGNSPMALLMLTIACFAMLRPQIWKIMHARRLRTTPGYGETVHYRISSDMIEIQGSSRQAKLALDQLFEVTTSPQGILLYHNKSSYTWLPRNAFDNQQAFTDACRQLD